MSKRDGKGARNRPLTRRVFMGNKKDPETTPWPQIYPCMLDTTWYKGYLGGKADEQIFTYIEDPDGWREDAVEDAVEDATGEDAENGDE
jgi:hypothetical protein